jgi:CubicO group peptidase (beta-lactamase class C family)
MVRRDDRPQSRLNKGEKMSTQPLKLGSRLLFAAASLAVLAACGPAGTPAPAEPAAPAARAFDDAAWPAAAVADATTLGFTAEGLAALDARMAKSVADQDVAGMVYILGKGGEIAAYNAFGVQSGDPKTGTPMTKDSMFRIYSMTKPITGVAMMQLFEQGKWAMEDSVSKHVPELASLQVLSWKDGKVEMKGGKPVTVAASHEPTMKELMSHTAGFAYGLSGDDPANAAFRDTGVLTSANLEEMIGKIKDIPLIYDPGSRWYYSVAVDIQGYIVQKLSGQKLGEYLKANIFTPLGMNDTSFFVTEANKPRFTDVYRWDKDANALVANPNRPDRPGFDDPNRLESGGGGLVGTTHDYARFAQMFLNKGTLGGNTVLKPETVELMRTNAIGDLKLYSDGTTANPGLPGVGFGMDFAVYDDSSITGQPYGKGTHYWGGAAGTWFWIDPANDLFFVGMIQSMGGARPDAMNYRNESSKLVYGALATAAAPAAPAEAEAPKPPTP